MRHILEEQCEKLKEFASELFKRKLAKVMKEKKTLEEDFQKIISNYKGNIEVVFKKRIRELKFHEGSFECFKAVSLVIVCPDNKNYF